MTRLLGRGWHLLFFEFRPIKRILRRCFSDVFVCLFVGSWVTFGAQVSDEVGAVIEYLLLGNNSNVNQ